MELSVQLHSQRKETRYLVERRLIRYLQSRSEHFEKEKIPFLSMD
jgi:hypothetical protein